MDDPPPPYSSIDMSSKGYPPKNFQAPAGPAPEYGATRYPAHPTVPMAYDGEPGVPPPGRSYYPPPTSFEPQPRIFAAPAGFTRSWFRGAQSTRHRGLSSSYGSHIVLSCFVICCCGPGGFMCGLLAFCVAICAQSFAESSPQLSRQLGTASMTLSLAGIAVSLLTVVLVVSSGHFHVHPAVNFTVANGNATTNDCLYAVRDRCFNSRKFVKSIKYCYDGYYLNRYCYRNKKHI